MVMEARDPEQTAMIKIATKARRVGSVLMLKSNFIAERKQSMIIEDELRAKEMGGSVTGGRECRNN
jgi:hypothetical protein